MGLPRRLPRRAVIAALVSAGLVAGGCGRDHEDDVTNPRDPGRGGAAAPLLTDLAVDVGNRSGIMTWSLADPSQAERVAGYTVWTKLSPETEYERRDSVAAPPVSIQGLTNGVSYDAAVRPVLTNGLQGDLSHRVRFTPGLFSVSISDGRESTASQSVVLSLQAPAGTQGVRLGSQEDLSGVAAAPYRPAVAWLLEAQDGPKRVYAVFTDPEGNASGVVWDEILLDTRASIEEIDVRPAPAVFEPGETVTFELHAGETGGQATVVIGQDGRQKVLRDDGSGADAAAGDGVYSLDYVIEQDLRVVDATVTGHFTDAAGNVADPRVASQRITVDPGPTGVTLLPPTSPSPTSLRFTWTQALEGEAFAEYRVVRAKSPGVSTRPERDVRTAIASRAQTGYTDQDVEPGTTYYYIVEVVDAFGLTAPSNEVEASAQVNDPPSPVVLQEPTAVSERRVVLAWSQSHAPDFAAYRVIRGTAADPLADPDREVLSEISNPLQTIHEDTRELEQGRTYRYVVMVLDDLGSEAASNVVEAAIPNLYPVAEGLIGPSAPGENSFVLSWTASGEQDFAAYRLYRSETGGVGETDQLAAHIDRKEVTQWLETGRVENTSYYYRLFVVDKGGLSAGSDEVTVRTANADPAAVTLASPGEDDDAFTPTVLLSWSASSAHDFSRYRVFRDTAPGVTTSSPLAKEIEDALVAQMEDGGLQDNTRYAYRVFVYDDGEAFAGSNERVITTGNRPPSPVSLNVTASGNGSVALSWTRTQIHDFQSYELYRSTNSSSFPTLVGTWADPGQTGHALAISAGDSTLYFFRLTLKDKGIAGNADDSSVSNVVSARGWGP